MLIVQKYQFFKGGIDYTPSGIEFVMPRDPNWRRTKTKLQCATKPNAVVAVFNKWAILGNPTISLPGAETT
jgi:hypothetical protein